MSAEISGFEQRDYSIVAQATLTAAAIQVETGVTPGEAYSNKGAEYSVMLTLVALRRMGVVAGNIDERAFVDNVTKLEHETLPSVEWEKLK